jgi:hypothetical protein
MAAGRGLVAAMLAAAAFAAPAQAGTVTTLVNSSALDLTGYPPDAALSVELVRKGALGDVVIGRAAGTATAGKLHVGAGGACWSTFTPAIRARDTIRVSWSAGSDSVVVPPVTVQPPVTGAATDVTGTAPDGPVTAELLDAAGAPLGDPANATAAVGVWTVSFPPTPLAVGARATVADAAGNVTVVDAGDSSPAGCPAAAFSTTAVTEVDPGHLVGGVPTINAAGAAQALTVQGPVGDAPVTVTLNGDPSPDVTQNGGTFTAHFPGSALAALDDGPVKVEVTGGVGLTMTKDTVAPGPPTSTPPPGRYLAAPMVTLAPPEPGASVHYTLDGSAPGLNSPVFDAPIHVTANETIRAFAVDGAGNPGPMVSLNYMLNPGSTSPIPGVPTQPPDGSSPPPGPAPLKPRIGAIGLVKRVSMARLQARGLTASIELGSGTTAVRFTVYRRILRKGRRRLKLVASLVRVPGHSGRYRVKLNARALGLTRPGLYRLKIVPGLSRATLDSSATRTVWLRVVA